MAHTFARVHGQVQSVSSDRIRMVYTLAYGTSADQHDANREICFRHAAVQDVNGHVVIAKAGRHLEVHRDLGHMLAGNPQQMYVVNGPDGYVYWPLASASEIDA